MSSNHSARYPLPDVETLRRLGAKLVLKGDQNYPVGLHDLAEPPPFLTVLGELPIGGIAIIGSRDPPTEAADFTFALAQSLGEPVISGLAAGIDSAAHRGALSATLQTLAYVGNGLATVYPPCNRELANRIVASGGGIASAEQPNEGVSPRALVRRDSFQAAHARAVVLVCSETNGGAMHTMHFAKGLRRTRFALLPKDECEYSGNRGALADGAVALPWNVEDALRVIHDRMNY
ncbi:MAG: DNA-processing protein DprA [Candidatus Eremiobacteraeota bacterium]|nr:DNA-processing protein DprA [Candidatus Eremiobacteraeota bacterium]